MGGACTSDGHRSSVNYRWGSRGGAVPVVVAVSSHLPKIGRDLDGFMNVLNGFTSHWDGFSMGYSGFLVTKLVRPCRLS